MKRLLVIAAMAAMFCMVACAPQPEVSAPGLEQSADGDDTTKTEGENNSQSNNVASGDNAETVEPEIKEPENDEPLTEGGIAGPDMPLILQAKDVWVGAHPGNYGINVAASEFEYSHFGIEFGFTGSSEEESDDLYTSWTEFAVISKWCDENVEIVNSMVETFKKEDVEIYHLSSTYAYSTIVDIEITADKPLWGVEVGQNLVDKFYLHSVGSPLLFSYPECKYMGNIFEMEEPWYKIFENCLWTQRIIIRPIEPVESIYDVVTFRIKLHSPDYVIDFEGGGPVTFVPDGYFENLINSLN